LYISLALIFIIGGLIWFFGNRTRSDKFLQQFVTERDTLWFTGKNFPTDKGSMVVKFNSVSGVIFRQTPDSLQVQVPTIASIEKQINIEIFANGKLINKAENIVYKKRVQIVIVAPKPDTVSIRPIIRNDSIKYILTNVSSQAANNRKVHNQHMPKDSITAITPVVDTPSTTLITSKKTLNTAELVKLSYDNDRGLLGGIRHLKITLWNNAKVKVTDALVEVRYMRNNGRLVRTEKIEFKNIAAHASVSQDAPSSNNARSIEVVLLSVSPVAFEIE
jgi:hypothetical protein